MSMYVHVEFSNFDKHQSVKGFQSYIVHCNLWSSTLIYILLSDKNNILKIYRAAEKISNFYLVHMTLMLIYVSGQASYGDNAAEFS